MGKMTEDTFNTLYECGKDVYSKKLTVEEAVKKAITSNPEVAESSAQHYINWYSKMRAGDFLSWNTNGELLKLYVKRIIAEENVQAAELAVKAARRYAVYKNKAELDTELITLATDSNIQLLDLGTVPVVAPSPNPVSVVWYPSVDEYHPGLSEEDWMDILRDDKYTTPNLLISLACYYGIGGETSVIDLVNKYGRTTNYYKVSCMKFAEKLINNKKCKKPQDDNEWPVLFQGRDAQKGENGTYIWKVRPELMAALKQINIGKYLVIEKGEHTINDSLNKIIDYITQKGFIYDPSFVKNYYLSLKAKPFVILAGTSGTGKTKLVELFAEAIDATPENGRYLLVPVRPDWSDSTDLLGHMNLNGEFVPGAIADFVYQANHDLNKPYFLCLDEMNLARVEYYLSDILSIIETRKVRENGRIGSLPLFTSNTFQSDTKIVGTEMLAKDKYENIYLSENLYIIGTVNMDETTFPFSKKVLDRANTIEFSKVDTLVPDFDAIFQVQGNVTSSLVGINNDFLKAKYTKIEECSDMKDTVIADCKELQALNVILEKAEAHVGYRVRDEIEFYLLYSREDGGIIPLNEAFDNEIMQKILPRIQGSGMEVLKLIESLITFCDGKYPKSKAKLEAMKARCGEYGEGYTSYWL